MAREDIAHPADSLLDREDSMGLGQDGKRVAYRPEPSVGGRRGVVLSQINPGGINADPNPHPSMADQYRKGPSMQKASGEAIRRQEM